jgi:GNAT superfamily N-acetyltransferase
MSPADLIIRPARGGEAQVLTELCIRAKAHWGYDAGFMTAAARLLRIRESEIGAGRVLVAEHRQFGANPCGVAAIAGHRRPGWFELSHLFIAPECFGLGIGRALFGAAIDFAARAGGRHVAILSDPNAAAFYEKLGARRSGEAPSGVEPRRMLPLFELAIDPSQGSADPNPG